MRNLKTHGRFRLYAALLAAMLLSLVPMAAMAASAPTTSASFCPVMYAVFPQKGEVAAKSAAILSAPVKGERLGKLASGDEVTVLGYSVPKGNTDGVYKVEADVPGGEAYVSAGALNVAFSEEAQIMTAKKGYAFAKKSTAKSARAFPIAPGDIYSLKGREGKWWVVENDGQTAYIQAANTNALYVAGQYDKPGVYAYKTVKVVKGNVIISTAGVTLKNMVIEGNLYLVDGINGGKITLHDVYLQGNTFIMDDAKITNTMEKLSYLGKPSEVYSKLFRENYPKVNEAKLTSDLTSLIGSITEAVYER